MLDPSRLPEGVLPKWFVGCLPQVPGVSSQGTTLKELEEDIRDAYWIMLEEQDAVTISGRV